MKIEVYIDYFHAIDIIYGFEEGALVLGIGPHVGITLGLTATVDFYVLRTGLFVEGNLFDGAIFFKLGFSLLNKLNTYYYCNLELIALKFTVGARY